MFWCSTQQRVCLGLLHWKSLASPKSTLTSLQNLRLLTTSPCVSTSREGNKPLKRWTLVVSPYSKVRVQLGCNFSIRPLDPHAFPESNRAFITVHGTSADQGVKLDNVHVHYNDQSRELTISAQKVNGNMSVELTAPVKSDLDIRTEGEGSVHVQKMECDQCLVQTDTGSCVLQSVKSHHVQLQSSGGAINGVGTIHGNVDISTSGPCVVDIQKIQGTILNVKMEEGPLNIKALYAENISLNNRAGSVSLGHVHGDCSVNTDTGNVTVDSSSGRLRVSSHSGDMDVYVGEAASAELTSQQGQVCVRVPTFLRAQLQLSGAKVEVSPEITLQDSEQHIEHSQTTITGVMNRQLQDQFRGPGGPGWIKAQAPRGSVQLKTQSWFQSLKLGG